MYPLFYGGFLYANSPEASQRGSFLLLIRYDYTHHSGNDPYCGGR
jgi:hypothetical protein